MARNLPDLFGLPCTEGVRATLLRAFGDAAEREARCLIAEWGLVSAWMDTGQADDTGQVLGPRRRLRWRVTGVGEILVSVQARGRQGRAYTLAWRTTIRGDGAETAYVADAWPGGPDKRP
jgi:hypothetical protein